MVFRRDVHIDSSRGQLYFLGLLGLFLYLCLFIVFTAKKMPILSVKRIINAPTFGDVTSTVSGPAEAP